MAGGSMAPELMGETLAEELEKSGFTAVEEYSDLESREVEGCLAVWSVDSVKLEDNGERIDAGTAVVGAEIGFKAVLMGSFGELGDRADFNRRCFDACSGLACARQFGKVSLKLGECRADMRQRRLVRELEVVFKVCMKEVPDGSV